MDLLNRRYPAICRISFFFYYCLFLVVIFLLFCNHVAVAEELKVQKKAEFAWVKENGKQYDIGYIYHDGSEWKGDFVLSTGNPVNFVPAMARNKNGDTWLVWSSDTGDKYDLYYAVITDSNKISEPLRINTLTESNSTPAIMFDYFDVPWIVWSGNDGGDDDIYYSKHNGNNWDKQKLVHKNNEVPDIFPQISLDDEGAVKVDWDSINRTGIEKNTVILQTGNSAGKIFAAKRSSGSDIQSQIFDCIDTFPENIDNLDLATIQLNCEESSRTVQFVGKMLKKR